jgi:hypothetical protein
LYTYSPPHFFRTARLPDGCELPIAKNHITFREKVNRKFGKVLALHFATDGMERTGCEESVGQPVVMPCVNRESD